MDRMTFHNLLRRTIAQPGAAPDGPTGAVSFRRPTMRRRLAGPNFDPWRIARKAAGRERLLHMRRRRRLDLDRRLRSSTKARRPGAPVIAAASRRARRRSDRRGSASPRRRNGRAIDGCARSAARVRATRSAAPRHWPRPLTRHRVCAFWPVRIDLHPPAALVVEPAERQIDQRPRRLSGAPTTTAQ